MRISIAPPAISAFPLNMAPNDDPRRTPIALSMNVHIPMVLTAGMMSTERKANETPIASASMLVAIASGNIAEGE